MQMPGQLNNLLRATSRSFYLTLRVLPARVRPQIGLAYLLARTTDTIADTELVPPAQRLDALQKLRERILGQNSAPLNFGELARQQNLSAEKLLLEKVEDSLSALQNFSPEDQKFIREVLDTITSGQELDLKRFNRWGESPREPSSTFAVREDARPTKKIIALETASELDDYTYRVAGCVGEFWTKICRAHLFPKAKIDDAQFIADGIRFGKGLQLVNILRDLPKDLRNGRCYLPMEKLIEVGLAPEDLLQPANEGKFRPLYNSCLDLAESHLRAGWDYTNSLPFPQFRVRLACAWPVLIGAKTISRLRDGNVLDPEQRIKIPRGEVRGIFMRSVLLCPFPGAWRKLFVAGGKAVASGANLT
jgi:farnesyl-diphosphate farnesyltransferase